MAADKTQNEGQGGDVSPKLPYHSPTVSDWGSVVELTRHGGDVPEYDGSGYSAHGATGVS